MTPRMKSTGQIYRQTFSANPQSGGHIDDWVTEIAVDLGIDGRTAFAARVCIAELVDNVIEHGNIKAGDEITLVVRSADGAMEVEFQDTAQAFDPTTINGRPPHAEAYEGGRGIMIVKSYADALEYWHDGRANHVKLTLRPTNRRR